MVICDHLRGSSIMHMYPVMWYNGLMRSNAQALRVYVGDGNNGGVSNPSAENTDLYGIEFWQLQFGYSIGKNNRIWTGTPRSKLLAGAGRRNAGADSATRDWRSAYPPPQCSAAE
jgi:hypothetical protein